MSSEGLSGLLKDTIMKIVVLAAEAKQHQLSYAKFSRALTRCDLGTPEFATKAFAESLPVAELSRGIFS